MALILSLPLIATEVGAAGAAAGAAIAAASSAASLLSAASLAWSIGSTLFSAFHGANQSVTGPRLKDLHVQSAAFGAPMKRFWGVDRMAGELVWIGSDGKGGRGIREVAIKKKLGGKGKGGGTSTTYKYFADFAISINAASNCRGVIRVWAGPKLIYDNSKTATLESKLGTGITLGDAGTITFYDGNENQKPPPLIEALSGVGNTSAYRNQFLAVFQNFEVTQYGSIPQFSFECFTDGDDAFAQKEYYQLNELAAGGDFGRQDSWSYVDPNGEIIVLVGNQPNLYGSIIDGEPALKIFRLEADGSIIEDALPPFILADPLDTSTTGQVGGNFFQGVADEPCMTAANGGKRWLIRPDKPIVTFELPAGLPGFAGLSMPFDFFAKKDDAIYFMGNGGQSYGLVKCNADTGAFIAAADMATLYDFGNLAQVAMGDDFLWVLRSGHVGNTYLLKYDPDTLERLDAIDLGSHEHTLAVYNEISGFFVENDNSIKLIGRRDIGVDQYAVFWEWRDGVLTELGTALAPQGFKGGTLFVRNGVWYNGNSGYCGQYDIPIQVWAPGNEGFCVPLWKIVRDICIACGMETTDINVSELTDCVRGYTIDQQMTGRDAILPLQRYGFFDGRERDLVLEFPKRGHDSVMTIPQDDMAARPSLDAELPDLIASTRAEETELPVIIHVRFKDQDASYQTGHAYSARLTSESKNTITVDVPIVMTATKAKQIADVLMANHWLERAPKEILVSRRYMRLDAADPVTLDVAA